MDIGLHRAGIDTKICVDKDSQAIKTLKSNSKEHDYNPFEDYPIEHKSKYPWKVIEKDVRDLEVQEILDEANLEKNEIDLLVGGSPCQPFSRSNSGNRKGTGSDRGKLYKEYCRILSDLEPRGFIFENVKGIRSTNGGKDLEKIKESFREAGYKINEKVINTADYGVPQKRKRLIILGLKDKKPQFPDPTHSNNPDNRKKNWISVGEALKDLNIDEKVEEQGGYVNAIQGKHGHLLKDVPYGANYQHFSERKYDSEEGTYVEREESEMDEKVFDWRSRHWNYLLKLDPERPSWTIQARPGSYTGPFHWRARRLSRLERMRLMDIPVDYHVAGDKQSEIKWQVGNAVPPGLSESLSKSLVSQMD